MGPFTSERRGVTTKACFGIRKTASKRPTGRARETYAAVGAHMRCQSGDRPQFGGLPAIAGKIGPARSVATATDAMRLDDDRLFIWASRQGQLLIKQRLRPPVATKAAPSFGVAARIAAWLRPPDTRRLVSSIARCNAGNGTSRPFRRRQIRT